MFQGVLGDKVHCMYTRCVGGIPSLKYVYQTKSQIQIFIENLMWWSHNKIISRVFVHFYYLHDRNKVQNMYTAN